MDKSRKKLVTECDNGISLKKRKSFRLQRKIDSNLNNYPIKMDLTPVKK